MRSTVLELKASGKFRTKAGWLKPYAFACGYYEVASHPTDKFCYVRLEAVVGGYEVVFHWGRGMGQFDHKQFAILQHARKEFSRIRRTIVVAKALKEAGV